MMILIASSVMPVQQKFVLLQRCYWDRDSTVVAMES
jgi:hypothetical protein